MPLQIDNQPNSEHLTPTQMRTADPYTLLRVQAYLLLVTYPYSQ